MPMSLIVETEIEGADGGRMLPDRPLNDGKLVQNGALRVASEHVQCYLMCQGGPRLVQ